MASPRVIGLLLLACFAVHAVSAAEVRKLLDTTLAVGSSGASAEGSDTASASSGSTSSTTPNSAYTSQYAVADAKNYYYYPPAKTDVYVKGVAVDSSGGGFYYYPSTSTAVDKANADCDAYGRCYSRATGSSYVQPYYATATTDATSYGSLGADVDTHTFSKAETTTPWYGRKLMTLAVGSSGASAEGSQTAYASSSSSASTTPYSASTTQDAQAHATGYKSETDVYAKGIAVQNGGFYYPTNIAVDKANADCDSNGNCHSYVHGSSSASPWTGADANADATSYGSYNADVDTKTFTLAKTYTPYWIGR